MRREGPRILLDVPDARRLEDVVRSIPEELAARTLLFSLHPETEPPAEPLRERAARDFAEVALLPNPVDQGWGGHRKLALRHALDRGCEVVVVVGVGQSGGEELANDLARLAEAASGGIDVVLGRGSKRAGGLQRLSNALRSRLAGRRLLDPDTPFRAYSTRWLRRVPFEIADNGRLFDVEILLQALLVEASIEEIEVEAGPSRPRGLGPRALLATLRWRLHRIGMLCSLKYRDLAPIRYQDKTEMLYTSHRLALAEVRRLRPGRVLDLGCGPGFVARRCGDLGARVTGVDFLEPLPGTVETFHRVDLETEPLPFDPFDFDMVLLLDVIEHLRDPERFLVDLRTSSESLRRFDAAPRLILSTPNVAFAAVRLNLLLGRFQYAERGILDLSHKRLFTRATLEEMLVDCGYRLEKIVPVPVPFEVVVGGRLGSFASRVAKLLASLLPRLFAFQFLVVCRPLPGVRQLLGEMQPAAPEHAGGDPASRAP